MSKNTFFVCCRVGNNFLQLKKVLCFHATIQRDFACKPSIHLLPEVEKLLESGEMKHRKHPGVRKLAPIKLPDALAASVDRILCDESERNLRTEAKEIMSVIASRRQPVEKAEIDLRLKKFLPPNDGNDDDFEDMSKGFTKQELIKIRKEIHSELKRWTPIEYTYHECLAYMVARLSANYASILKVFSEIKTQLPDFQPKSFFDFGSGVGSAHWAAHSAWHDSIEEYFCVDTSPHMNNLAETLITDEISETKHVKNVYFRQFLPASDRIKYDLVVSAFSLLDLPSAEERLRAIDTLWRKTKDLLVIIEFGNFAGFFSVLDARDYILHIEKLASETGSLPSSGAHVLMPCAHDFSCPMLDVGTKRSCGVNVSYETLFPRHHQVIKKDWISYVVLRKGNRPKDMIAWPRLVQPVLKKAKHVYCRACCSDGKINEFIVTKSKHGRHAYRTAKASTLGDLLPITIKSPEDVTDNADVDITDNQDTNITESQDISHTDKDDANQNQDIK